MGQADTTLAGAFFGEKKEKNVPFVPLRDAVIFPKVALPLVIKREDSLKALEEAKKQGNIIVFSAQKNQDKKNPKYSDLYAVGTLAKLREIVQQPDGSVRILAEGVERVHIKGVTLSTSGHSAQVSRFPAPSVKKNERIEALMYSVLNQFRRVVNMGANVPFDVLLVILNVTDPWMLGNLIAANVEMKTEEKQEVLEAETVEKKLDSAAQSLGRQIKVLQMASKIQAETGRELDKMQREVFLREQMKSIEKELEGLGMGAEADDLLTRIEHAGMPADVKERALKEYNRLKGMPSFSPELSYVRTYLEWLTDLPWNVSHNSVINMKTSRKVLDTDHYGLEKVKDRILEYLAVQKMVGKIRGPILCFAGPPGTGKTSIGKSIARALGREFHRISLGGIRDEAEIRGHRRTYVGALPGRIIQGIATAKTRNPVFMLDEIDKIGADFRGDPAAALLEALDPEQNDQFSDHYLEVPFDLSDVMFITTANMLDTIPPALLDRMEIIQFPGYTEEEKLKIAQKHLIPKTQKENGVTVNQCGYSEAAIRTVIQSYTREAGVRNLERELSNVCRKIARKVAEGGKGHKNVKPKDVESLLGPKQYEHGLAEKRDRVGVVTGLAWTQAGGEILQIEATRMNGKGSLILTGHLGKVMQESATAAFSHVRSQAKKLGIEEDFNTMDMHVHVPSGAIPKDGPSAGLAIATAIVSALTGQKVRRDVAMTGEMTLRGHALEIGGLKEKVLAAHRAGIAVVLIPKSNSKDLVDIPPQIRKAVKLIPVEKIDDILSHALVQKGASTKKKSTTKKRKTVTVKSKTAKSRRKK